MTHYGLDMASHGGPRLQSSSHTLHPWLLRLHYTVPAQCFYFRSYLFLAYSWGNCGWTGNMDDYGSSPLAESDLRTVPSWAIGRHQPMM